MDVAVCLMSAPPTSMSGVEGAAAVDFPANYIVYVAGQQESELPHPQAFYQVKAWECPKGGDGEFGSIADLPIFKPACDPRSSF
jgi:hypothetical protein